MKKYVSLSLASMALLMTLVGCGTHQTATTQNSETPISIQPSTATAQSTSDVSATTTSATITQAQAQEIALSHAGYALADVTMLKAELDKDDSIVEYEVEFLVGNQEFDYEINASTGEITSFDNEVETPKLATPPATTTTTTATTVISEQEAKEIALSHAGVQESEISRLTIELDEDDGIQEYEVEWSVGKTEYEYEINALTGAILGHSKEVD